MHHLSHARRASRPSTFAQHRTHLWLSQRHPVSKRPRDGANLATTSLPSRHRPSWSACIRAWGSHSRTQSHGPTHHELSCSKKYKRWPTIRQFEPSTSTNVCSAPRHASRHGYCMQLSSRHTWQPDAAIIQHRSGRTRTGANTSVRNGGPIPPCSAACGMGSWPLRQRPPIPTASTRHSRRPPSTGASPCGAQSLSPDPLVRSPATSASAGPSSPPPGRSETLRPQPHLAA